MTDYWVSCKKHYCEVCNIWISGHPINVKTHENTPKHLTAVRNAIIDSHKREKERRKAEAFEKEELERLEKIVNNETKFSPNLNLDQLPPLKKSVQHLIPSGPSRDEERKMIERFYASKLKTHPEFNDKINDESQTRAKIVSADVEKKLELALGPEWIKKFDPIRNVKYFHNQSTGQVKLISDDLIKSLNTTLNNISNCINTDTASTDVNNKILYNNISNTVNNTTSKPSITINIKSKAKNEEDNPQDCNEDQNNLIEKVNEVHAPVIGNWEAVKPEESAFNLPIYIEQSVKKDEDSDSEDDLDPLDVTAKPIFVKPMDTSTNNKNNVNFSVRDVSVIKRPKRSVGDILKSVKSEPN